MPVKVVDREGRFRVVEAETGAIATNAQGTPVDGGGHTSRDAADKQAAAINARKKIKESARAALENGLPGILSNVPPGQLTGGVVTLAVELSESAGPFSGITSVPPGVLELVPESTLAELRDSREIYWTPFMIREGVQSTVREETRAAIFQRSAVVKPEGNGNYGVWVGGKRVSSHKDRAKAVRDAMARNRMMRGGLPGTAPESVMLAVTEWLEAREEVELGEEPAATTEDVSPHDDTPHWHMIAAGAAETGPPVDGRDDHTHAVSSAGEIMEAEGHTHMVAEQGDPSVGDDAPAPKTPIPPPGTPPTV